LSHLARAHCSLTVYPSAYTFLSLSIKLCRWFTICVSPSNSLFGR
jgi:hypothetical protein